MKWIAITFFCLLSFCGQCQTRTAIFNLDMKSIPHRFKTADAVVHVREVVDRSLYLDSSGMFNHDKFAADHKLDTLIRLNADFAFHLPNLKIGSSYSVSMYYNIALDTFNIRSIHRTRSLYQEVRINNWTLEYKVRGGDLCSYDGSLTDRTCPKCRRKDMVQPILYGFDANDPAKEHEAPVVAGHNAGYDVTGCDPNWFCKRDKMSF